MPLAGETVHIRVLTITKIKMGNTVIKTEFIFDFGSPNAYLSHLVLRNIEDRTGVTFEYIPILLGGVFKLTNNVSPAVALKGIKNKAEYRQLETDRFIERHKITHFKFNPFFPVNTLRLMRGAVFAKNTTFFKQYVSSIFNYMWVEPKKMDDLEVLREVLMETDLPADEILQAIENDVVKENLFSNTEAAVGRGVFGAPTFFVDDALFFGKDKLPDVEEEILRKLA